MALLSSPKPIPMHPETPNSSEGCQRVSWGSALARSVEPTPEYLMQRRSRNLCAITGYSRTRAFNLIVVAR